MSSLILKVSNSSSGGSGGEGTPNREEHVSSKDSVVVSAAVDASPLLQDSKGTLSTEVSNSSLRSTEGASTVVPTAPSENAPIAPVATSSNTNSNVTNASLATQTKIETVPQFQSSMKTTITSSATVVVTTPSHSNVSSQINRQIGPPGAQSVTPNSAATTVITAVPPVSVKPLQLATVTQQLPPKLPQQPSPKISNLSISSNPQAPITTNNPSTTVIGTVRANLQPPPISFTTVTRPHQLTIPSVNHSKQSSPSPTITLSPIKPQGATLVTAIQSSQAQHHPAGTVFVTNNTTPTGATIVATHRQLHTVTQQPHRQLQQTVVQQQPSTMTRVAPTLITGHAPGTHQHVVQHHPPPLRMVHLPAGASSVTGGNTNVTTRIAVSAGSNISSHVPPTTVSLPQNPAPIAIRHALPQSPLARSIPVSSAGVSSQLPRSPIRHPQLPQTPVAAGGNTTLLTTSRSPQSAPPAHLSSASIITHHPQQSSNAVLNRTAMPLASVLASANQQRQIQQQLVTQRVLSTGPGGTSTTVVQGIQQPHPGIGAHTLNQATAGTIMVNPQRPGTLSMLPQVPASGTVTAGGLLVHHPSSGGGGHLLGGTPNQSLGQHTVSGTGHHHLVSFPSNPVSTQPSSNQRIALPPSNMLAHLSGAQHHGGVLTVSAAISTSGSISAPPSVVSTVAGRQSVAALTKSSTTILPPNALHHLLASHPHPQQQSEDDLDMAEIDGQNITSYHQSLNAQIIGVSRGGTTGVTLNTGRTTVTLPSLRQQQQTQQPRDRRSLPCQLALQDHNYYSRPPPTPPPPPQSPPNLRDVLQEHQRRQQQLHPSFNTSNSSFNSVLAAAEVHHQQQQQLSPGIKHAYLCGPSLHSDHGSPSPTGNRSAFSPPLQASNHLRSPVNVASPHSSISPHTSSKGAPNATNVGSIVRLPQYTPDSQKFAAAMVAPVPSPPLASSKKHQPHLSHSRLVSAINGPTESNVTSASPVGKIVLPSRVEAHFRSIQEAGVGPMAPLVEDVPSDSGSISPNNEMGREGGRTSFQDRDDGEETETAPEAEGEEDSITRCICDFLHDDGYMICCDKCLVWQHVVCMGLDKNNIPDEYLCEVCKPRPIDRKRAKAMQARRRTELYHNSSSSDDGRGTRQLHNKTKFRGQQKNDRKNSTKIVGSKKFLDKKIDRIPGKDMINKRGFNSKLSKKTAAQALAMLNSGSNNTSPFASSNMIPKQLLPTNLLENSLNVLDDNDGNVLSHVPSMTVGNKLKKQYKKRKPSDKDSSAAEKGRRKSQQLKKQQNRTKRRSIDSDGGEDIDATTDEEDESTNMRETTLDASQHLRSWIDQYEEAVTNHYSPELRARLAGAGKWGGGISNGDLRPSVIGSMTRCNVSLQGNGVKILTASSTLSSNTPIIECKGKLMLSAQYKSGTRKSPNDNSQIPVNPYVFFYQLSDSLEICLDGKTYGNDSRFCRRSVNDFNAELRHVIDKGSLHLFIITLKNVEKNQEILLPPDRSCHPQVCSPLPSINADLREISMKTLPATNGMISPTMSPASGRSSDLEESTPLSSTRNRQSEDSSSPSPQSVNKQDRKSKKEKRKLPKLVLRSPKKSKAMAAKENKATHNANAKKPTAKRTPDDIKSNKNSKQSATRLNDVKTPHKKSPDETEQGADSTPNSPTKYGSNKASPGKLGLPDNSGLIVGVNTINYDASSELKNKAKSREERKMEMIMKAFEAMERAEQKKRETQGFSDQGASGGGYQSVRGSTDSDKSSAANKRRRSSAKDGGRGNVDSNIDASSAEDMANDDTDDAEDDDEATPGGKIRADKGKQKKSFGKNNRNRKSTAPNTPKRRRSRISSGGSGSGNEELSVSNPKDNYLDSASTASTNNPTTGNSQNGPFRFPKTKKTLMSDWLQEANEASRSPNPSFGDDDDVSANYLKGSRSPPGIAMHLLRSSIGSNSTTAPLSPNITSPHSPVKTIGNHVCSAKKRWLRQAISEDHGPGEILSPVHEVTFLMNGNNSPLSSGEGGGTGGTGNVTLSDYVTPLKKRRLQSYKDEQRFLEEEANASSEENNIPPLHTESTASEFTSKTTTSYNSYADDVKVLPNGIKKKLLHNLVLEAVLDRAMEDMLNVKPKTEMKEENTENEVATNSVEEDINVKNEAEESLRTGRETNTLDTMTEPHADLKENDTKLLDGAEIRPKEIIHNQHTFNENEVNSVEKENNINIKENEQKVTTPLIEAKQSQIMPIAPASFSLSSSIPEPSSVFKSFFKSNVSIEALEAELEETKKQREAEQKQLKELAAKQHEEEIESQRQVQKLEMKQEEAPSDMDADKYEHETNVKHEESLALCSTSFSYSINKAENDESDIVKIGSPQMKSDTNNSGIIEDSKNPNNEVQDSKYAKPVEKLDTIHHISDIKLSTNEDLYSVSAGKGRKMGDCPNAEFGSLEKVIPFTLPVNNENICTPEPPKPKEKRKVSLADYKRRRQEQQHQLSRASSASDQIASCNVISCNPPAPSITPTIHAKNLTDGGALGSSENSSDSYSSAASTGGFKPKDIPLAEGQVIEQSLNVTAVTEGVVGQLITSDTTDHSDQINDDFGASTPTMDEDQIAPLTTVLPTSGGIADIAMPASNAPITLNTLPLFEKLEKLEKAQKENKKKVLGNVSPPPEPKREDLTERLKKEFGLTVDADDDDDTPVSEDDDKVVINSKNRSLNENHDDGDATPEEDSPPPPAGSSLSSIHRHPTMTRLPEQIAQYPTASATTYNSTIPQSNLDSSTTPPIYPSKSQFNSNYGQTIQPGQPRYPPSQAQQTRASSFQHSSGSYSHSQQHSYQRHPPPPSRSHLTVNHPGHRMTYPPPLPPASVIANAPHPNKINSTDREVHSSKSGVNNFKRSNGSKEKEYYSQHSWSSERDSRSDRDREQRATTGNNRSYYASTTSRGMPERNSGGSRLISGEKYTGDKLPASREYNRREYSQIRSGSSAERVGSHGSSDRDLRGGGNEHGSSGTSRSSSSRSSKSGYSRSSYYNN